MNVTEIREFAETATESERLAAAAEEFFARQDRRSHPEGWTDRAGRWYPSDAERAPLCATVRKPSAAPENQTRIWSNRIAHLQSQITSF